MARPATYTPCRQYDPPGLWCAECRSGNWVHCHDPIVHYPQGSTPPPRPGNLSRRREVKPVRLTPRGQRLQNACVLVLCAAMFAGFALWWVVAYTSQTP